ncbi:unnamed protein product [Trichogramma brassicae]|uniref:Uncharacterized protein n=1 Tax=Trichogramma brassicae TaxID=86971 RepID=A0A6H5J387_9HYME|nr:unnamed protein product [Trichogramma brassicae]
MSDQPANSASEVPRGSENVNPQENIPASNNTPTNGNATNAPTNGNATDGGHPIPGRDAYAAAVRSDRIRFSADLGELSINFGGERYMTFKTVQAVIVPRRFIARRPCSSYMIFTQRLIDMGPLYTICYAVDDLWHIDVS